MNRVWTAARGWVLTNAHDATHSHAALALAFVAGESVLAERLYVDPHLDPAVLRFDPRALPAGAVTPELECDTLPSVGHPVGAFGHPWGFRFTGTRGITSAGTSRLGATMRRRSPVKRSRDCRSPCRCPMPARSCGCCSRGGIRHRRPRCRHSFRSLRRAARAPGRNGELLTISGSWPKPSAIVGRSGLSVSGALFAEAESLVRGHLVGDYALMVHHVAPGSESEAREVSSYDVLVSADGAPSSCSSSSCGPCR